MRRFVVERLLCPRCHTGALEPDTDVPELVFGPLRCPHCRASFPVNEGVADLVVDRTPSAVAQRGLEVPVVARAWDRWLRPALVAATGRRPLDRESEVLLYRSLLGKPEGPVLEVGCGTGFVLRRLARTGDFPSLVGLDASRAMLEEALAQGREAGVRVDLVRARVPPLPFQDGSMGAVLQTGSLHLVADAEGLFTEVGRVLRPGAPYVLATTLPRPGQKLQARLGVHLRSEERLRAGLEAAGLVRVERLALPPFLVLRAEKPRQPHVVH
ncbi:MAG: methyltransferase domain-containing protein [Myxococcaceae bacterium]|nr:methyltransferase domain-containing protein [Myxococcaceae bacterium]MCI0671913.1 methyltransferase domain-containing protein [Myxococcaceae bacterium]